MTSRTMVLAFAVLLVGVVAVPAAVAQPTADTHTTATAQGITATQSAVEGCAATPPADYADPDGDSSSVVGWVEGYWYNEPVDIVFDDGLNETELRTLSARTAARFEALRCLTVQNGLPPVEVIDREEFADDRSQRAASVGEEARLVQNARFETTLTINSETDSVDVEQNDTARRVGGFYDYISEEIVVITDDTSSLPVDEAVLAEELGHAIQDQQFDIARYDRTTVDRDKGILGLIEGDVGFVIDQYTENCDTDTWNGGCFIEESGGEGGGAPANWGLYFEQFQPYSDGPSFVQEIKQEGGWKAVNALYEEPPTTALHTTYPDSYNQIQPRDLDVPDRSTGAWERVSATPETLGISTIAGMFAAPGAEQDTEGEVIGYRAMLNLEPDGSLDRFDPHDYSHPQTEGWRGDELYTYRNGEETATVWATTWASPEAAQPFLSGYRSLIDTRGGERVDGTENTYSFDEDTGYDMVLSLVPDGDRVTVVTAPTVDALSAVDQTLDPFAAANGTDSGAGNTTDGTGENNETDDGAGETNDTTGDDQVNRTDSPNNDTRPADDTGPGFGVALAGAVVVLTATLLAGRRARNG